MSDEKAIEKAIEKAPKGRRQFLLGVGAGAAAAGAAVIASRHTEAVPEVAKQKDEADTQGKGYQVTAHVQNYYRTAKV